MCRSTYYLYDGDSLGAEVDGTGAVTRSYTWGDAGLISTQTGNDATFARFDPLGNLSGQFNGIGAVVQEMAYKAYGGSLGGDATDTIFAWQGLGGVYTDHSAPGIVQSGSRPYMPDVGRFGSASAPGSGEINQYSYASGNPTGYSAAGAGEDDLSNCGSWGSLYGHAGRQGVRELTSGAAFQPGSEDRRKLSAMACAIPGVGEVYMGYMAATGHDAISGTCLSIGERAFIAATLAVPAATKYLSKSKWLRCLLGGGCFVAGTPVQVAVLEEASRQLAKKDAVAGKNKSPERLHTVTKPIEQVREGDLVASRNPMSGKSNYGVWLRRAGMRL